MTIKNSKAIGNAKFGFFFEDQARFDSNIKELLIEIVKGNATEEDLKNAKKLSKYRATYDKATTKYIVSKCTATNNLFNFGGLYAYNTIYENCTPNYGSKGDNPYIPMHRKYKKEIMEDMNRAAERSSNEVQKHGYLGQIQDGDLSYGYFWGNYSLKSRNCQPQNDKEVESRQDLIDQLGVLSFKDDTVYVKNYTKTQDDDLQKYRIYFEKNVLSYDSGFCYEKTWIVGKGIVAEIDVDLDSDGVDELLLLYCKHDLNPDLWMNDNRWVGLIYEPVGNGYVKAGEIPLSIFSDNSYDGERSVHLIQHDGRKGIAVIRNWAADGGGNGYIIDVFDYYNNNIYLAHHANIAFQDDCYAFTGPMPLEKGEKVIQLLNQVYNRDYEGDYYYDEEYDLYYQQFSYSINDDILKQLESIGMRKDKNLYLYGVAETDFINQEISQKVYRIMEDAASHEIAYGIHLKFDRYKYAIWNMEVEGRTLLTVCEDYEDTDCWDDVDGEYMLNISLNSKLNHG